LVKYLGYGKDNGQYITNSEVTIDLEKAVPVYYANKVQLNWTGGWLFPEYDYSESAVLAALKNKINKGDYSQIANGYRDRDAFKENVLGVTDKQITLPSPEKAFDVVIGTNGILKINNLPSQKEEVTIVNKGSYAVKEANNPVKLGGNGWLVDIFEYIDFYYGMGLGSKGNWGGNVEVLFTLDESKKNPTILSYYVPGRVSSRLTYYEFNEGTDTEVVKEYEVGNIVAMKSLTICSETQCNDEGNIYTTQTGQFYNHNYAWYGETPSDAPTEEIMKDPLTRIHEAMSKLRIGEFYRDEQGLHDGAPDIRFQKTYLNTKAMTFYPLSIPFFTNSEYGKGVIKHDGYAEPGYNQSYYIGLYSAQHRANEGGDAVWGSWKEAHTSLLHPRAFQAGAAGTTDMPHYRAYEIIFANEGTNTITFRNQSLLSNNENSYVKGLLPYYMADGGTYVTKRISATEAETYWSRFAVWRHPLYFSNNTGAEDDYWHFFANPMPYEAKIVQAGYIYEPGQPTTETRQSIWTDTDVKGFLASFMSMQDGIGIYKSIDETTSGTPSTFIAGDPFFVRSQNTIQSRPGDGYFIEDNLGAGAPAEAIISYEGTLLNGVKTRSALRSTSTSPTTKLNLVEKDTKYNNHTYLVADKNAIDTQSAHDAFAMYGGGLNIWTNRDDYKLGAYGYNPDNGTTIPLGLTTYKGGEYEITADNIPAGVEMWIYKAGKPVCCLNDGAYTFSAPKSTRVDDLTLVTRGTDPTANEEISANEQNIRAYMVGSTCRIEGLEAGMTYNVYAINGATVANGTAHANVANVALPTPGVYVVKVVSTNNEEQVIKIKY